MKRIALIGVGIMGRGMVKNLLKAGFEVQIFSRTKSRLEDFLEETDVPWCDTAADCVRGADAVITMVGFPKDVEEVYFGSGGILDSVSSGQYLIDMTTTDPKLSVRIFEAAEKKGVHALDAPVSGGASGAQDGTLSIMAGGKEEDFRACLPIFRAMGKTVLYEGPAGFGQHTKMANQIAIAGCLSGVCEALSYAEHMGLDTQKMFDSISRGAAESRQMTTLCPKMIQEDYSPSFFLKHFIKDMKIAASQDAGELPVLDRVLSECSQLEENGDGDLGTQALIRWYRK